MSIYENLNIGYKSIVWLTGLHYQGRGRKDKLFYWQTLQQQQQTFPNQLGTTTTQPTARWAFQFFYGIHVLICGSWREIVLNCNDYHHHQLLNLLGERYRVRSW